MLHAKQIADVNDLDRHFENVTGPGVLYTDSRRRSEAVLAVPGRSPFIWVGHYQYEAGKLVSNPLTSLLLKGSPIIEGAIIAVHIFARTFKHEEWDKYNGRE